jgi:hypothetical protein
LDSPNNLALHFGLTALGNIEMSTGARSMLVAAVVLGAGLGDPAAAQTAPRDYEAFIRAEINKCVAEAVRLDKEAGALKHPSAPTQAQRVDSCREMVMQVHDLYPAAEQPKKKAR